MKRISILTAGMMVASCGISSSGCKSPDPKGIVAALRPREHFRSILTSVTERTQTVAMATAKDGSQTREKLAQAIEAAVERHDRAWEQNLIDSWSTLTADELKHVCTALNERDRQTFRKFAERVGSAAKARNEPLIGKAGAEVLGKVWSK